MPLWCGVRANFNHRLKSLTSAGLEYLNISFESTRCFPRQPLTIEPHDRPYQLGRALVNVRGMYAGQPRIFCLRH